MNQDIHSHPQWYINAVKAIFKPEHNFVLSSDKTNPDGSITKFKVPISGGWQKYSNRPNQAQILKHLEGYNQGHRVGIIPAFSGLYVVDYDEFDPDYKDLSESFLITKPAAITTSGGLTKHGQPRMHAWHIAEGAAVKKMLSSNTDENRSKNGKRKYGYKSCRGDVIFSSAHVCLYEPWNQDFQRLLSSDGCLRSAYFCRRIFQ